MLKNSFMITLESAHMISPHVRHLAFRGPQNPFTFIPGQFLTIHFEQEGKMLHRSYSIATIPGRSDLIEFAIGEVPGGPGTELLFGLKSGDQVLTTGPFGKLVLKEDKPCRYIMVSTSTGVAPYRAMLPVFERLITQQNIEAVILQGVQHRTDLLYAEDFLKSATAHPQFKFRAHYSREPEIELLPHEYRGYVQTAFEELQADPQKDIVYLCGNPNMVDEALIKLQELGFDSKDIRREKYISGK